jgi:hypothetical protein
MTDVWTVTKGGINFHSGETPVVVDAGSDTKSIFDRIWSSLGSEARGTFTALNLALDDTLTALNLIQDTLSAKRAVLNTNKGLIDYSLVKIVTPATPNMGAAMATINNAVQNYVAIDIARLNAAVARSMAVRSPADVTLFEKQKIDQVNAQLSNLFAEIRLSINYVMTIKSVVQAKLNAVP